MYFQFCFGITRLALILVMTLLAATPNLAAPVEERGARQGVILPNPPKPGSQAHKILKQIAGKIIIEPLAVSGAEIWWIYPSLVDSFLHTADEQGIVLHKMGQEANHLFSAMSPKMPMSPRQKSMMARSMSSKSTTRVMMMHIPTPFMVEYALTRNMNAPAERSTSDPGAYGPADIVIPIDADTRITVQRTSVKATKKKGCVWQGRIKGTDQAVTLMWWWSSGRLTGSFSYGRRMYSIKDMGNNMYAVVEKDPALMPTDHSPMPADRWQDSNTQKDILVNQGDASAMRARMRKMKSSRKLPSAEKLKNLEDAPLASGSKLTSGRIDPQVPSTAAKQNKNDLIKVSVLVGYTSKAASHYTDIHQDLIMLAAEQTNQTFRNSGITNVEIEVVGSFKVDYDETSGHHFDHLWRYADKGDGYMEKVHRLRDEKRADIALLILDDPSGCGLSTRVAADPNEAFSVVHHECATSTYSFAHEIGHLFGARHDRSLDKSKWPFPYGHGYVNGLKWRTMMSYRATCKGCPRLPIWSNPDIKVRGENAGTELTNNAKVIYEQAKRMAGFR